MALIRSSSARPIPWVEEEFTPTNGQVTFILSTLPIDPTSLEIYVNGVLADSITDYTISGLTVTWLNTEYSMSASDKVMVRHQ